MILIWDFPDHAGCVNSNLKSVWGHVKMSEEINITPKKDYCPGRPVPLLRPSPCPLPRLFFQPIISWRMLPSWFWMRVSHPAWDHVWACVSLRPCLLPPRGCFHSDLFVAEMGKCLQDSLEKCHLISQLSVPSFVMAHEYFIYLFESSSRHFEYLYKTISTRSSWSFVAEFLGYHLAGHMKYCTKQNCRF